MPKNFLLFGPWGPDSRDRDVPFLEKATNLFPIFNTYRNIRKKIVSSSSVIGDNINSCFAHFYTKLLGSQVGYPTTHVNNSDGAWVGVGGKDGEDLYKKIDEREANDNDRIVAPNAPIAATALMKLASMSTPVAGDKTVKYRYKVDGSSAAWTIDITVMQPETGAIYSESITQITDTVDTDGWQEGEFVLLGTAGITDWSDLYVKFEATVPGSGAQVKYCGEDLTNFDLWTKEDGETVDNLYESIDADAPVDDTYIKSIGIEKGKSSEVKFRVNELQDPDVHVDHLVDYRMKASGSNLNAEVIIEEDGDKIASKTVENVPTIFTAYQIALTSDEAKEIKAYSRLDIRIRAYAEDDIEDSGDVAEAHPSSLKSKSGPWTTNEPAGSFSNALGDNAYYVQLLTSGAYDRMNFNLETLQDPGTNKNHRLAIKGYASSATALRVEISSGGIPIAFNKSVNLGTMSSTVYYELSEDEAALIQNYGIIEVQIAGGNFTPPGITYTVEEVYLEVDAKRTLFVSQVKVTVPDDARASISMFNFRAPTQYQSSVGDIVELYAGIPEKIFLIGSGGFADVSRAGSPAYQDLAVTGEYAPSWSFCSWGNLVIATNYVDPVQYKGPSDSVFGALFTSTNKPQGKFCAVVSNFLAIANIKYSGALADGEADEVWWSGFDDATDMDPDVVTQCDRQRIVNTPGEITGFVGGEYGTLFKANSIHRMTYVGATAIMRFDTISRNQGTKFPRSIVPVENDIYFYGNGAFYVLRNGIELERIGDGMITKTFVDEEFEDFAIDFVPSDGTVQKETEKEASIIGAYDRLSGLVIWSIRSVGDEAFRNNTILFYNPQENRFGFARDANLRIASIDSLPISADAGSSISRNVFGISMGTDASPSGFTGSYFYFNEDETYDVEIETKVLSSAYITKDPDMTGRNITIQNVRPIFRGDPSSNEPEVIVTITGAEDQLMLTEAQIDTISNKDGTNIDGWININGISGEFFVFNIVVQHLPGSSVKEFDGIQVDWVECGV